MCDVTSCLLPVPQGLPGQDGPPGPRGVPGCNGTKVSDEKSFGKNKQFGTNAKKTISRLRRRFVAECSDRCHLHWGLWGHVPTTFGNG